jgi:catechol 2,3-dioxygenase-like lactoylglutathione lyase family enzyme
VVAKRRSGDPWQTPPEYGATLAGASLNLIVRDVERSLAFYVKVLRFHALYSDADFAALEWGGLKVQLHADHTWEHMPWHPRLAAGEPRGLGAEVRLLGPDPDEVEKRAREVGATVMLAATDFPGHGWRECYLEDPDGYVWVTGRLLRSGDGG